MLILQPSEGNLEAQEREHDIAYAFSLLVYHIKERKDCIEHLKKQGKFMCLLDICFAQNQPYTIQSLSQLSRLLQGCNIVVTLLLQPCYNLGDGLTGECVPLCGRRTDQTIYLHYLY